MKDSDQCVFSSDGYAFCCQFKSLSPSDFSYSLYSLLSFGLNKNIPKKLPTIIRIFKFQINISALVLRRGRRLSIKSQEKGIKTIIKTQTFWIVFRSVKNFFIFSISLSSLSSIISLFFSPPEVFQSACIQNRSQNGADQSIRCLFRFAIVRELAHQPLRLLHPEVTHQLHHHLWWILPFLDLGCKYSQEISHLLHHRAKRQCFRSWRTLCRCDPHTR